MPTKARIPLPADLEPPNTRCFRFNVPDNPEWLGMFWGALYNLSVWTAYERSGNTDAADVASIWRQVIAEARETNCACLDWYIDFGTRIGIDRSANRWIAPVPMDLCGSTTQFFVGHAPSETSPDSGLYGIDLAGYDYASSDYAGGKITSLVVNSEHTVIGNVFTVYTLDCLGDTLVENFGGNSFTKLDFVAQAVAIASLAPFTFGIAIEGPILCTVA